MTVGSVSSTVITVGAGSPSAATCVETTGGVVQTFTDCRSAGGIEGQPVAMCASVAVSGRRTAMV